MSRDTTYFISDCHLGASYIADSKAHERILVEWLRAIAPRAKALYLLGDIIDYWFEYRYVAPRGYTRFFGALASLADSGVEITWMRGNHDIWLFDYLSKEIGLTVADGVIERTIDGRKFVMSHGDGIGRLKPTFRLLRSMFRNPFLQKLYAMIHPRWTVGFAHAWSAHNREHGKPEQLTSLPATDNYVEFARNYECDHGAVDYFIFGHRHIAIDQTEPNGTHIVVLGDAFENFTFGQFDGREFRLLNLKSSKNKP